MKDLKGRSIEYLRVSLTDRCNLRCSYCMPKGIPVKCLKKEEVLTLGEIVTLVQAAATLGIKKIKLTGGEPLLRQDLLEIISALKAIPGIMEVTLTTNGILLPQYAEQLVSAGLDGLNLSLDTLDRQTYETLTGYDGLQDVLLGLQKIQEAGLKNIKINAVPLQSECQEDVLALVALAQKQAIAIRFIELMPIGEGKQIKGITGSQMMQQIEEKYGTLTPYTKPLGNGPANYYSLLGFVGKIGFIHAVSNHFCDQCNRIRITCNGEIKPCLHYQKGVSLKPYLKDQKKLVDTIEEVIWHKPASHVFESVGDEEDSLEKRMMFQIGG